MFDISVVVENSSSLLQGLFYGFKVSLAAIVFGSFFGTILALMHTSHYSYLRITAKIYINFFRSIPLVQIMLSFYIILPFLIKLFTGQFSPVDASKSAYYSFSLFEAAYFSEIIRTGIQSVPKGHLMAARSLGLTHLQGMFHVVLPQAYRAVFLILMTQIFIIFQDVSLVYAVGALDFFGVADQIAQREFCPTEMYLFSAVIYFFICYFFSHFSQYLEKRLNIHR